MRYPIQDRDKLDLSVLCKGVVADSEDVHDAPPTSPALLSRIDTRAHLTLGSEGQNAGDDRARQCDVLGVGL